ncbi:hypothetical protein, partial [Escherichia coli]
RTVRQFGTVRALVTHLVARPPGALVDSLLAVALALLLDGEADGAEQDSAGKPGRSGYNSFTVVDQAVSAAASEPKSAHAR